jgi:F420-dependent methylenetetrahydromethanopterin dehydrogenase
MSNNDISADVLVAIAMALYEIQDQVHDVESNILTLKRPQQEYLPWTGVGHGMLVKPNKK